MREFSYQINFILVILVKLFLDTVSSPSADDVFTLVVWMFSWTIRLRVKLLGLSSRVKSTSYDCLFVDPFDIPESRIDLKIT